MKIALLGLLLVACQSADDKFPAGGGGPGGVGGNGGNGSPNDGSVDSGDGGGPQITGRVCLLTDLRQVGNPRECADTGAGHWTVSLGTSTAISEDNGAFTITAPQGSGFVWHVTAGRIITSAMAFGTDNTIPVLLTTRYQELQQENGVPFSDQQGSIVVRVVRSGQPVPNIIASSDSDAPVSTLYDSTNAELWSPTGTGTGSLGVAWFPAVNLPQPARQITVSLGSNSQAGALATTKLDLEDQTITFVTQELPALP